MTGTGKQLLAVSGVTKAYPGVVANSDVSFSISEGEVHALLGENGAGKSTLVKMIYGLVKPDAGSMRFRGQDYAPAEPRAARAAGVAMVFQHFSLFEALNVAENVALGMENPPPMRELAGRIKAVSEEYGLPVDPHRHIHSMSVGERQRVEIVRCLLQSPRLHRAHQPWRHLRRHLPRRRRGLARTRTPSGARAAAARRRCRRTRCGSRAGRTRCGGRAQSPRSRHARSRSVPTMSAATEPAAWRHGAPNRRAGAGQAGDGVLPCRGTW